MNKIRKGTSIWLAIRLVVLAMVGAGAVLLSPRAGAQRSNGDGAAQPPARVLNVAVVLWNGCEILDWAGPAEVLAVAQNPRLGKAAFNVYTVASSAEPITSQGFAKVTPGFTLSSCPKPDIIVLPGGGEGPARKDRALMSWLRKTVPQTEVTMSVCTGAFLLGDLGVLNGIESTTWFGVRDRLQQSFPKTKVRDDVRYVDSGRVITTAGVSAGIDGALHLVARLMGKPSAVSAATYMEYEWRYADEE